MIEYWFNVHIFWTFKTKSLEFLEQSYKRHGSWRTLPSLILEMGKREGSTGSAKFRNFSAVIQVEIQKTCEILLISYETWNS